MVGNNGKKYFYDKGRLSCMVNVIGGVAFDSYYIHIVYSPRKTLILDFPLLPIL